MRLKNNTDISTDAIRDLIRSIRPPGIANFDVRVGNTARHGKGRAYTSGSSYHDRKCPFIVIYVATTDKAARGIWPAGRMGKGYLEMVLGNRMEVLITVLAHELRHMWQARVTKGRRVWGARGKFSERDADAYALQMLRRYRRGELSAKGSDLIPCDQETAVAA